MKLPSDTVCSCRKGFSLIELLLAMALLSLLGLAVITMQQTVSVAALSELHTNSHEQSLTLVHTHLVAELSRVNISRVSVIPRGALSGSLAERTRDADLIRISQGDGSFVDYYWVRTSPNTALPNPYELSTFNMHHPGGTRQPIAFISPHPDPTQHHEHPVFRVTTTPGATGGSVLRISLRSYDHVNDVFHERFFSVFVPP